MLLAQSNLTLRGGAELTILKIAEHYNPIIYTAEYDRNKTYKEFSEFDIRIISKGRFSSLMPYSRASQGLDYGLAFYNIRIREDYDIINAHLGPSHWIRNNNERVLWHCHTPLRDIYDLYDFRMSLRKPYKRPLYALGAKFVRRLDQKVVKKIEQIVTNGPNTLSRIKKYYNRDAFIVGSGVDSSLYRDDGDSKYFFYPSRFSPNKRQEYAIRAFQLFSRKMKGYRLILAGSLSSDPFYTSYYRRIVALSKKTGNIKILTDVPEKQLIDLYSRSTAVLYSPLNEDLGVVPLQAMASGKVIISVNEGGPKDTIKNGKTGFLVNSEAEMATRMLMVVNDSSLKERIGKAGRYEARKRFSWDAFLKRYDAAIKRMPKNA